MASEQQLNQFFSEVERRAFRQVLFAMRDQDLALDIVQEAMLRLVEKYRDKPADELPLLFQRILQNAMKDHWRRQKVRNAWGTLLSSLSVKDEQDEDSDPLEILAVDEVYQRPDEAADNKRVMQTIQQGIAQLPMRQREAFMLRYYQELDVAETAHAMQCSEGSVKTHTARAIKFLANYLQQHGIDVTQLSMSFDEIVR